jgi:hypothetical protein
VYASERLSFNVSERPLGDSQGQNRNREIRPSGSVSRIKLVCSVGDRPTKVIVRGLVAWIAERKEIEFLMPIDKAIFQDGEQVIGP